METEIVNVGSGAIVQPALDASILVGQVRLSTIAMYTKALKAYGDFAGSLDAMVQPATLARWRTHLVGLGKLSPNSINRMLSSVRTLMKEAEAQGYVSAGTGDAFESVRGVKVSAMRDRLKKDARTRISKADMRKLCDAPAASPAGLMHRALLLTMATSGCRISEVVSLTTGQIEYRDGGCVIHVTGKTDTTARQAPISREACAAIDTWLGVRSTLGIKSEYVFTGFGGRGSRDPSSKPIRTEAAWQTVKRYAKKVGLASIKPHDFRRFVGTTLAKDNPRQAQKVLGHERIETTFQHYVLDDLEVGLTDNLF